MFTYYENTRQTWTYGEIILKWSLKIWSVYWIYCYACTLYSHKWQSFEDTIKKLRCPHKVWICCYKNESL